MPKFIDHHEMSDVAPEMAAAIGERIKAGEADEHGVKGLNVYLGKDGTAFCLSEAPDAEAVVKAHEAYGFSLDSADVVEVQSVV
ncbi:MAG TPA: nickel-binding protein [Gaiellaceae bacterium]|nr:nickel-binding protein [Gaiellaceae bacterium]